MYATFLFSVNRVGLLRGVVATKRIRFSVDPDLSTIPTARPPVDAAKTCRIIPPKTHVLLLPVTRDVPKVIKSIVSSVTVAMVYLPTRMLSVDV